MKTVTTLSKSLFFFAASLSFIVSFTNIASAEQDKPACGIQCHENPQFTKEDKHKIAQCIQCHSPSAHRKAGILGTSYAEAADTTPKPETIVPRKKSTYDNMVHVPEGEFIMGTDDRLKDEKPAHVVYINGFYIDLYEVTNAVYKEFIDSTGYNAPGNWIGGTFPESKGQHPVTFVSWYDSNNFCKWNGKRLPREREWEKAARGTDGRVYPWGNKWDMKKSNNPLSDIGDTQPVGSYEAGKSPFGLYDVSGNVWEWVDEHYFPHPGSDYINPEFGKKYRLLKGGSWFDCSFYSCGISAPVYNRAFFEPEVKGESYGFRCAKD